MLSILPEADEKRRLRPWAQNLRDTNRLWMGISQKGVQAFVAQAMGSKALFAFETVFSHWKVSPDGEVESKIDMIRDLQKAGYFVLLLFVGLTHHNLSIGRVQTRKSEGGHDVAIRDLIARFPRTPKWPSTRRWMLRMRRSWLITADRSGWRSHPSKFETKSKSSSTSDGKRGGFRAKFWSGSIGSRR